MAITGGFGMTLDLERGTRRQWVMGKDGVRRWADDGHEVRACTCHPDDSPPRPCGRRYALGECRLAAARDILRGAIDTANVYAGEPHEELRIVTLRMDDALRVLAAMTPNTSVNARAEGTSQGGTK